MNHCAPKSPFGTSDEHSARTLGVPSDGSSSDAMPGHRLPRSHLGAKKGIEMNISAVWAAICIDFGLSRRAFEGFMLPTFAPGYAAVYEDQRDRAPFSFRGGYQIRA